MPLLDAADALPGRPARVLVAGGSGSGKTTLAGAIGTRLGLPHTEIDALFHGPGWTRRPEFEADVAALVAGERWVTEYLYSDAIPVLLGRCDLLVSLELPRRVVMRRVVVRTVRRVRGHTPLWNGNVEPPLRTVFTDPEHIVRWAWRTHGLGAERTAAAHAARPELPVVVLRRTREVTAWLDGPLAAVV